DKDSLFDYLEKATPYYQSIYGNVTGQRILVISAGAPMFTGGLGSTDSLFVHKNASRATIAHEYAHVWQQFQTIDEAGRSSIWLNEGDADLHGALSRFVTETQPGFGLGELRKEFKEEYDQAVRDPVQLQPLTAANYGGPYEQVAYKKGLFTLLFLDHEVRNLTGQRYGLRDILAALNEEWQKVILPRDIEHRRMSEEDVLRVVDRVVGQASTTTMRPFWERYVTGSPLGGASHFTGADWPPYIEAPNEVPIVFSDLQLDEERILPGGELVAHATATNVHAAPETRNVQLVIDDQVVAQQDVTVPSLQATHVTLRAAAGAAGDHTARIAYLHAPFRVLTPAALAVERVAPSMAPQVGVPFDLEVVLRNTGEAPARTHVAADLGTDQAGADVDVPGSGEARPHLALTSAQEGRTAVELRVTWGGQMLTTSAQLTIGPRDQDGDGAPDAQDGYPDNPALTEKNIVNDVRNAVPGAEVGLVLLALAGAALARRR
ncbi:MAG: hypothetical protein LC624_11675, partial [Halobacteriales archaeon]|nr:hypothetical protein [Halobacteriales archaeon]